MTEPAIRVAWAPDAGTDKRLLALHAHWSSLRPGGGIPRRADFDPSAIRKFLPWVALIDVLDSPREYRFRVVGTAISKAIGRNITGLSTGDVFPPAFQQEVIARWNDIVANGGPNWAYGRLWITGREFLKWQGLLLPFRSENARVEQLWGGAVFGSEILP